MTREDGHNQGVRLRRKICGAHEAIARVVPHSYTHTMSAVAHVQQVAKTVAVSTGKVANAKSMMIWRPHGNKYVVDDANANAKSDAHIPRRRFDGYSLEKPRRASVDLEACAVHKIERSVFFFDVRRRVRRRAWTARTTNGRDGEGGPEGGRNGRGCFGKDVPSDRPRASDGRRERERRDERLIWNPFY